ncbi:MAG: hypothetical protein B7X06_04285 [Verrucomicrobia bacterium 21-51-4]|nr:MAG: hypothetical protein B7X06_04285 [Verrucomicrobia bacterium 21-51-4]
MHEALEYTFKHIAKPAAETQRQIAGVDLLEGFRRYVLEQYGPMTLTVLNTWGIKESLDLGNIVFNLVEYGVLGKTDGDKLEDFKDGLNFQDAFVKPFQPRFQRGHANARRLRKTRSHVEPENEASGAS